MPVDANGDLERVKSSGEPVPVEGNEDPCRNERRPRRYKRPKMRLNRGLSPMKEGCTESCLANVNRTRNGVGRKSELETLNLVESYSVS